MREMPRVRRKPIAEINVVPYIDVMLVLLVIFMITTPLLKSSVEVELPQASAATIEQQDKEPLILSVDKAGQYYLNIGDEPESALVDERLVAMVAAVMQIDPEKQVLVRGDKQVDYEQVVHAMALLQGAGVQQVGLLTEQP